MNRLLKRQIKNCTVDEKINFEEFLKQVDLAYEEVESNRKLIERTNRTLEDEVMSLNDAVNKEMINVLISKKKIDDILENIQQGILTVDENCNIGSEYSQFLKIFYKKDSFNNCDMIDTIFPGEKIEQNLKSQIRTVIQTIIDSPKIAWKLNKHLLPSECQIILNNQVKTIACQWAPILNLETSKISKLMLTISDLTKQRLLEDKIEEEKYKNAQTIVAVSLIMANKKERLSQYIYESKESLDILIKLIDKKNFSRQSYFEIIHTLKGNSRILGFQKIAEYLHNSENIIEKIAMNAASDFFSSFKEIIHKIYSLLISIEEILIKFSSNSTDQLEKKSHSLHDIISESFEELSKHASNHNLHFKSFNCSDEVLCWKDETFKKIRNVLVHAFTNVLDHGYILPNIDNPNNIKNQIDLLVQGKIEEDYVIITVSDSGFGLNVEKIKESQNNPNLTWAEINQIIFSDGFSTAKNHSLTTSGRGSGLSIIQNIISSLQGTVEFTQKTNEFSGLLIKIPKKNVV